MHTLPANYILYVKALCSFTIEIRFNYIVANNRFTSGCTDWKSNMFISNSNIKVPVGLFVFFLITTTICAVRGGESSLLGTPGPQETGVMKRYDFTDSQTRIYTTGLVTLLTTDFIACGTAGATGDPTAAVICAVSIGTTLGAVIVGTWKSLFGKRSENEYEHDFLGGKIVLNYPMENILTSSHILKSVSADKEGSHIFGYIVQDAHPGYQLEHQFYGTDSFARRDGAISDGYHRVTLRLNQNNSDNLSMKRDHSLDTNGDGQNVEASYFWRDWDTQQEAATADHEDQVTHDISEVIRQDPNQGHFGTFQMQFYNGEATDDCGYAYYHPKGYSFHGGETEGYLNQYCD